MSPSSSTPSSSPQYILYCDGASRGNPGPAAYGWVMRLNNQPPPIASGCRTLGSCTNNYAEYQAMIAGLQGAASNGVRNLSVFADSELVIRQINGIYKVRQPDLQVLFERVQKLRASFDTICFAWLARHQNSEADALANLALDEPAGSTRLLNHPNPALLLSLSASSSSSSSTLSSSSSSSSSPATTASAAAPAFAPLSALSAPTASVSDDEIPSSSSPASSSSFLSIEASEDDVQAKIDLSGLSQEQNAAFDLIVNQKKCVFLTGCAGTGKSFLLHKIITALPSSTTFCTASTGVAASALPRGTTVHYWAGMGVNDQLPDAALIKIVRQNRREILQGAKVLIIDEVSMISGEFFSRLEYVVRAVREDSRPFGGLQVVLVGDFFQLPPVSKDRERPATLCFESPAWPTVVQQVIMLKHVFRQSDSSFIDMLNQLRVGECPSALADELISRCGSHALQAARFGPSYRRIVKRVAPDDGHAAAAAGLVLPNPEPGAVALTRTKLSPFNNAVDENNAAELARLPGAAVDFVARFVGDAARRPLLEAKCNAPQRLQLKVGAQVVLLRNLSFERGLVNGSRGRVIALESSGNGARQHEERGAADWPVLPVVEFSGGVREVIQPALWELRELDRHQSKPRPSGFMSRLARLIAEADEDEVAASLTQIPLRLAWSLTIHKCQGMSLDFVEIDLSRTFEHGMIYTALSRCRSMEGLLLTGFDPSRVQANAKVLQFFGLASGSSSSSSSPLTTSAAAATFQSKGAHGETPQSKRRKTIVQRSSTSSSSIAASHGSSAAGSPSSSAYPRASSSAMQAAIAASEAAKRGVAAATAAVGASAFGASAFTASPRSAPQSASGFAAPASNNPIQSNKASFTALLSQPGLRR